MTRQAVEPQRAVDALRGKAVAALLEFHPMLLCREAGSEVELWLNLELLFPDQPEPITVALLAETIDPYEVAAELLGVGDALVHQVRVDRGLDARAEHELLRRQRLRAKRRREETAAAVEDSGATACDYCSRSWAFMVEGAKLCKRHAEELGVRPHGKVGAPDEEPEETA